MATDKIFSVKKFLGVNQYADSETDLKPGEAADILNFSITDGGNLALRPGIRRSNSVTAGNETTRAFPVYYGGKEWVYTTEVRKEAFVISYSREGEGVFKLFPSDNQESHFGEYKTFESDSNVWLYWLDENGKPKQAAFPFEQEDISEPYVPLVISGGDPSGGGVTVEQLNILSDKFRAKYIAKDRKKEYLLPDATSSVISVTIGNTSYAAAEQGAFDFATKKFTFKTEPNDDYDVEFLCEHSDDDIRSARRKFFDMRHYAHYNGSTDTRTFFYGDGTNICYYTGVPAHGSGLYVPAGNELAVDFSDSPITGMVRHYSRLLAFKPDGVDAITYEPVTLEDGSVIAGFFLRPVSRDFGNDAMGQVVLVDNSARSISKSGAYDWHLSSGNYRDERYAKRVSDAVVKSFAKADGSKIVTCDDGNTKTWYAFLNDEDGTVLVNRYGLDVWSIYRSEMCKDVTSAFLFDKKVTFLRNGRLFYFDPECVNDETEDASANPLQINAYWESGFQDFGAAYMKKDSSQLWVAMLPDVDANLHIELSTDVRDDYEELSIIPEEAELSGDISQNRTPFVTRLRIKLRRFVYCKLIFRVTDQFAAPTILGYDQQIRFSSSVK